MPNPIDRCASCGQPVYCEEAVPNSCGCPERELRILLAQQRQRNNSGNTEFTATFLASVPSLDTIDPGIFMSPQGRTEFDAARQLAGPTTAARAQQAVQHLDEPPGFDLEDGDWTGLDAPQPTHNARTATAGHIGEVDLAAMWMEGSGIPYDRSQLVVTSAEDFEFSTEMDVGGPGPRGGGGARFRVDGSTPRPPMNEVGRVRGHTILRERPERPERPPRDVLADLVQNRERVDPSITRTRPEAPVAAERPVSAVQQARLLQAQARTPSIYSTMRNNPIGSDD
jgi:hypothetical protein